MLHTLLYSWKQYISSLIMLYLIVMLSRCVYLSANTSFYQNHLDLEHQLSK